MARLLLATAVGAAICTAALGVILFGIFVAIGDADLDYTDYED